MGLTFHCEKDCSDCPLGDYDFPKMTAWGVLMSAGIHPDREDCGKAIHSWRPVFKALAGFTGSLVVPTLDEFGLQSVSEHNESDDACKRYAQELLGKLNQRPDCVDCKLWWCY